MTDEELVAELIKTTQGMGKLLQPGMGAFQLQTLLAIKEWALEQLPVKVGDRVTPSAPLVDERGRPTGWWAYKDLLVPGNVAVVEAVEYNAHWKVWQAHVRFEAPSYAFFSINVAKLRKVYDRVAT